MSNRHYPGAEKERVGLKVTPARRVKVLACTLQGKPVFEDRYQLGIKYCTRCNYSEQLHMVIEEAEKRKGTWIDDKRR